jgi:predicted dehydrogenase/threonine dehydrogenase-like Zn-dependent dehydrogenase
MKQVFKTKKQRIIVEDVPEPKLTQGQVLVHNSWSLISAGTETGGMVLSGDLRGQIALRRDLIGKGIKAMKSNSLKALVRKAVHVDNIAGALGYSTAGTVLAVADDVKDVMPGQRVACAGSGIASHAELVCVPRLLVHPVPDELDLKLAAWTTVGCIALQGVRQGDPSLGEQVLVVGLGLLGLMAVQMLKANGCRVTGVDLLASRRELALQMGAEAAFAPDDPALPVYLENATGGLGADCSLIFAGTSSSAPLNQSMHLVRKRGRVVVVGAIGMDLQRSPFYQKEIEMRIACSYGPGRYDARYEQRGVDYPAAFVRWTENRNMGAVLELLRSGQLDVSPLMSSEWDVDQADRAFTALKEDPERQVGVMLRYPEAAERRPTVRLKPQLATAQGQLGVGIIGAGGFTARTHLPKLHGMKDVELRGISTRTGMSGKKLAVEFGIPLCTSDPAELIADPSIQALVIGTRHDSHAVWTLKALEAGKHVFVEKPAAITLDELEQIRAALEDVGGVYTVGYNRRYAPLARRMKQELDAAGPAPVFLTYRINAGMIPPDHWVQQRMEGGGRLIGEGCHFIDLANYLAGGCAHDASIRKMPGASGDAWALTLAWANGSLAQIQYVTAGAKALPKERVEAHVPGRCLTLDNFSRLSLVTDAGDGKSWEQDDKGHGAEIEAFVKAIQGKPNQLMSAEESLHATEVAILMQDWLDGVTGEEDA